MDMLPLSNVSEERRRNQYLNDVTQENEERQIRNAEVFDPNAQETQNNWYATQVSNNESLCPLTDNLTTLMFIVASGLSEAQRERLTSSLSFYEIPSLVYVTGMTFCLDFTFDPLFNVFGSRPYRLCTSSLFHRCAPSDDWTSLGLSLYSFIILTGFVSIPS